MSETNIEKIKKQAKELVQLTLKEATQLIKILKEEHGIEAAAPVAVASSNDATPAAEVQEEKTIFDVTLQSAGASKLGVIKVIKNLLDLGLKEAKEFVESAPQIVKEGLPKEEAEKVKKELTDAGAEAILK